MKSNKILGLLILAQIFFTSIFAYAEVVVPVDPLPAPQVSILIRSGEDVVFSGSIDLPASGNIAVQDFSGTTHDINTDSVLGILYSLTQNPDPSFTISDLEYYSSFNAFYLKCITPKSLEAKCDNWQYVVNSVTPPTGMDSTILSGGESIGLYFGNPHQLLLDKNSIYAGESVNVTAQKYNYLDNTWGVLDNVNIDLNQANPSDPWNPTLISETPVDANGKAAITVTDAGSYSIGIKEDFSFPSYPITVNAQGGGGGGGGPTYTTISIPAAASFLTLNQKSDGSFGDALYTDWAAVAIGALSGADNGMRAKISDYLKNNPLSSTIATDNERRAMALMSVGINPYTGTGTDYINKIVGSFNGNQFGDTSLSNDDIFALLVLYKAGYTSQDSMISTDVAYVLSQQLSDGSWGGVDMTAAAVMALRNFQDISGVQSAISKGENFLTTSQQSDGGYGNSSSTSWALQALSGNSSLSLQTIKADDYIARLQQTDGGVDVNTNTTDNRVWATSYAITGALHLGWSNIMQSFQKVVIVSGGGSGGGIITPPADLTKDIKKEEPKEEPKPEEIKKVESEVKTLEVAKDIKVKKQKKNKVVREITKGEVLGASTVRVQDGTPKISTFHKVIWAIGSPFLWLWGKLGF